MDYGSVELEDHASVVSILSIIIHVIPSWKFFLQVIRDFWSFLVKYLLTLIAA